MTKKQNSPHPPKNCTTPKKFPPSLEKLHPTQRTFWLSVWKTLFRFFNWNPLVMATRWVYHNFLLYYRNHNKMRYKAYVKMYQRDYFL